MANTVKSVTKASADDSNDGIVNVSAARGQTIVMAYGKDVSALKGTAQGERGKDLPNTGMSKSLGKS